jgi:hypothetical protein
MQARTTNAVQPIVVFLSFRHNAIHDDLNKKLRKNRLFFLTIILSQVQNLPFLE